MNKQTYTTPDVKIVHFEVDGAILIGSLAGIGANVIFEQESDFDSFFNPTPIN